MALKLSQTPSPVNQN